MAVAYVRFARLAVACLCLTTYLDWSAADDAAVVEAAAGEPAVDVEADADAPSDAAAAEPDQPTHKQSSLVEINAKGLPTASVQCFCLTGDDSLLAGCTGSANEIRVFNAAGEFVKSIELSVSPEAINVAPDGTLLVGGEGKLLRLNVDGKVVTEVESPHAAAIRESVDDVRKHVIEQHKQQKEMLPQMMEAYDAAIKQLEDQIKEFDEEDDADQLKSAKEMLETYVSTKKQVAEQFGGDDAEKELTEEKIDELVKSAMQYKIKIASISSNGEAVFVACGMAAGHGYAVWRMTPEFTDGEMIVSGLSGCCGQMDVQANGDGVFVAENSRKRVRRFDADGKSICNWGKASDGIDGFGSCCNPMNLAFGKDGAVYTAEDTTGRIKRYSSDGELLSVVGAADVVPGCKKVSIGVDASGDRVYMLDITRNHVAVLTRAHPDPVEPLAIAEEESGAGHGILKLLGF